jgi:hypothetical protein
VVADGRCGVFPAQFICVAGEACDIIGHWKCQGNIKVFIILDRQSWIMRQLYLNPPDVIHRNEYSEVGA